MNHYTSPGDEIFLLAGLLIVATCATIFLMVGLFLAFRELYLWVRDFLREHE